MIRSVLLAHEAEIRDSLGEFVYLTRTGLRTVEAYYTLPPASAMTRRSLLTGQSEQCGHVPRNVRRPLALPVSDAVAVAVSAERSCQRFLT